MLILFYDNTYTATAVIALGTEFTPIGNGEIRPNADIPFIPSRKRKLKSMQESAAWFQQPTGSAAPSLFPANSPTMHDHLHAVTSINPRDFFLLKSITPQIRNITSRLKDTAEMVARERSEMLKHIESLSPRLDTSREQWRSALPLNSPSADINFPVLHLLLTSLNYKDKQTTKDISRGLPIAGRIDKSNISKAKHTHIDHYRLITG